MNYDNLLKYKDKVGCVSRTIKGENPNRCVIRTLCALIRIFLLMSMTGFESSMLDDWV